MKNYLIVFVVASFFLSGCCQDSCITEEKCKSKHGLIKPSECPSVSTCDCAAGVVLALIEDATAQSYIAKAKTDMTGFVSGILIDQCQMCLLMAETPQEVCVIIGLMPDATPIIVGSYINTAGTDTVYVNLTGVAPGGPICPPGTRCS